LFVTPVYYHVLSSENVQKVSQEINNALPKIRQADLTNPWQDGVQTTFKYTQGHNNDVVKHNLSLLRTTLFEHVSIYLTELCVQPCEVELTESWFNFGRRGAYQAAHSHPSSTLSAVYYHQTNEQDGNICFHCANPVYGISPLWKLADTLGTREAVAYTPRVGKVIIFPSYLLHSVYENKTEDERISIACNFLIKEKQ
jgi:uncharacterized protein (TIGR02466 family)